MLSHKISTISCNLLKCQVFNVIRNKPQILYLTSSHYCSSTTNKINENLIYYGTLTPKIKAVKVFSLVTSLSGLAAQPILLEQGSKLGGPGLAIFLCGFVGFFTFCTPFLLNFVTKKYVTEIHYSPNTDEYRATTLSLLLRKINTNFRPNDVQVPEVPGMFSSINVGKNKVPLFLDPSLFEDIEHYYKIMGYDKPIDYKLPSDSK